MSEDKALMFDTISDAAPITTSGGGLVSVSVGGSGLLSPNVGNVGGISGVVFALVSVASDDTSGKVASGCAGDEVGEMSAPAPTAAGLDDGRKDEVKAGGSGDGASLVVRRSLAPAKILSSSDRGLGGVRS